MKNVIILLLMILMSTSTWARVIVVDPVATYQAQSRVGTLSTMSSNNDDGLLRSYQVPNQASNQVPTISLPSSSIAVGDEIQVRFFDDVSRALILTEEMPTTLGHHVFMASLKSDVNVRCATVIETSHGILIDLNDFTIGRVYQVTPSTQMISVKEYNPNTKPRQCSPPIVPDFPDQPESISPLVATMNLAESESMVSTFIDVLVVYDAGAVAWVEGEHGSDIATFAEAAVQKMNTTIANTGLTQFYRFRLVGTHRATNSQTNLSIALTNIQAGHWSGVHDKRREVGADLVCGLLDTGEAYGHVGLAYALKYAYIDVFGPYAYSASSVRSVAQSDTMTHEVGHNVGAGHGDKQATSPGPQLDVYSSGYYFTAKDQKYHTVMAYNSDGYWNFYMSAPYFSSPDHTHEGVVVGTVTKNDNTRTLENTYIRVAAFMPQVIPTWLEMALIAFSPSKKEDVRVRYQLWEKAKTLDPQRDYMPQCLLNMPADSEPQLKVTAAVPTAEGVSVTLTVSDTRTDAVHPLTSTSINGTLTFLAGDTLETLTLKQVTPTFDAEGRATVFLQGNFVKAVVGL